MSLFRSSKSPKNTPHSPKHSLAPLLWNIIGFITLLTLQTLNGCGSNSSQTKKTPFPSPPNPAYPPISIEELNQTSTTTYIALNLLFRNNADHLSTNVYTRLTSQYYNMRRVVIEVINDPQGGTLSVFKLIGVSNNIQWDGTVTNSQITGNRQTQTVEFAVDHFCLELEPTDTYTRAILIETGAYRGNITIKIDGKAELGIVGATTYAPRNTTEEQTRIADQQLGETLSFSISTP
jgi:hypothetical protein